MNQLINQLMRKVFVEQPLALPGSAYYFVNLFRISLYELLSIHIMIMLARFEKLSSGNWGILVKKVICVAPGHKKCRIFVLLSVAHLRFLFKGLLAN